ncbi:hypothetical protein IMZ48_03900 [Candidatus Bathyarchaeota archaeon]|nr:hypothetical protein [Candidatus Bathyarchaeota archaeon]
MKPVVAVVGSSEELPPVVTCDLIGLQCQLEAGPDTCHSVTEALTSGAPATHGGPMVSAMQGPPGNMETGVRSRLPFLASCWAAPKSLFNPLVFAKSILSRLPAF